MALGVDWAQPSASGADSVRRRWVSESPEGSSGLRGVPLAWLAAGVPVAALCQTAYTQPLLVWFPLGSRRKHASQEAPCAASEIPDHDFSSLLPVRRLAELLEQRPRADGAAEGASALQPQARGQPCWSGLRSLVGRICKAD